MKKFQALFFVCVLASTTCSYAFRIKPDLVGKNLKGKVQMYEEVSQTYKLDSNGTSIIDGQPIRVLEKFNKKGYRTFRSRYSGTDESKASTWIAEYDKKNNLLKLTHKGSKSVDYEVVVYNEERRERIVYAIGFAGDTLTCSKEYYDKKGNEIEYQWLAKFGDEWEIWEWYKKVFDNMDRVVLLNDFNEKGEAWTKFETSYSENTITQTYTIIKSEAIKVTVQEVNEHGDIISEKTTGNKGESVINNVKYEYDSKNNWTRKEVYEKGILIYLQTRTIEYY